MESQTNSSTFDQATKFIRSLPLEDYNRLRKIIDEEEQRKREKVTKLSEIEIKSRTPEKFGTVTGGFLAYAYEVTNSVLGIENYSTVYFAADENFRGAAFWAGKAGLTA